MPPFFDGSFARRAEFLGNTEEFRRIRDIPRRTWSESEIAKLAAELTRALKTREGTQVLRPAQALALHDIAERRGLLGQLRVGSGKSLISFMAPFVLNAWKPLLVLPAGLIGKTVQDIRDYSYHWKIPKTLEIRSYEWLAQSNQADWLTRIKNPDALILDEAHRAKNLDAGVTKRLERFMDLFPETPVVILTGSLSTWSMRDWAHLCRWALKGYAMVPDNDGELLEWADALDECVQPFREMEPGPLLEMATNEDRAAAEGNDRKAARLGFRRRMAETSGVVFTSGESVAASLYVRPVELKVSEETESRYKVLREEWKRPDGETFDEAMHVWKCARELVLGFCYVWDPLPPDWWLEPRSNWAKFTRTTLERSRTLDTPGQVKQAVENGELEDLGLLNAWLKVKPGFVPKLKALWHDDSALKATMAWMKEKKRGIVWCEHTWFAEELSRRTRAPYFGRGGLDKRGRYVEKVDDPLVILSIAANSTGRNLQKNWADNLFTSFPTTSTGAEQGIGRTHRDGQTADAVTVDVLLGCREHWDALDGARAQAFAERDTLPGSDQAKLIIGDVTWPTEADIEARSGFRWRRTKDVSRLKRTLNVVDLLDELEE